MKKLLIIGNGFDKRYGLNTDVNDYREILKLKQTYDGFCSLTYFESYSVEWCNFEESLGEFCVDDFALDNIKYPDYSSDHESDRDYGITYNQSATEVLKKNIMDSLIEMVDNANSLLSQRQAYSEDILLINSADYIINFNYTSTVERLFGRHCYHIHGFLEKGTKLIFGYKNGIECSIRHELNDDFDNHDYYVDEQKKEILDFYDNLKKDYQTDKLVKFLEGTQPIDEIVVIGHSLGDIDREYFNLMQECLKPTRWTIYYFTDEDLNRIKTYSYLNNAELIRLSPKNTKNIDY